MRAQRHSVGGLALPHDALELEDAGFVTRAAVVVAAAVQDDGAGVVGCGCALLLASERLSLCGHPVGCNLPLELRDECLGTPASLPCHTRGSRGGARPPCGCQGPPNVLLKAIELGRLVVGFRLGGHDLHAGPCEKQGRSQGQQAGKPGEAPGQARRAHRDTSGVVVLAPLLIGESESRLEAKRGVFHPSLLSHRLDWWERLDWRELRYSAPRPPQGARPADRVHGGDRVRLVTFEQRAERREVARRGAAPLVAVVRDGVHPIAPRRIADEGLGFETLDLGRIGARRLGALLPPGPRAGDVVDLNRALAVKLAVDDVGAPEAEADSLLPPRMLDFLRRGETARRVAAKSFEWAVDTLSRYDGPDLERARVVLHGRDIRLCAPLPRPGKIVGVARNYPPYGVGPGHEHPSEPVLFLEAPSSVVGPGDEIAVPSSSRRIDPEGVLAAVIGRAAHHLGSDDALEYVAGYTAANDVTRRESEATRGEHFIGKSCDTFTPLGPALVTTDEIPDPQDLGLRTTVSGDTRQSASTKEMTFSVAELIAFASSIFTLEPGDVILTGTPASVGVPGDPVRWLRDGDVVDVEIDRIGRLRNYVRDAQD